MRKFAQDRQTLVTAFLAMYPVLCQEAARRLRGLYNPADYPPIEEVTREFGLSWQYVSFGVPDQLKGISQEVWEQERDKAAQRMAEASSEIQQVLRQSMADLVAHAAERLKDGADGKPLRFKQSTVSNLWSPARELQFTSSVQMLRHPGVMGSAMLLTRMAP